MEPKLPSSDRVPELRPASPEHNREVEPQFSAPETEPGQSIEQRGRQVEATYVPAVAMPTAPIPTTQNDDSDVTTALPPVQSDIPATASDTELIEKEWVDKAKKVISETKDDPYRREQEVNRLQADYLFKRYGRTIGSPQ